MKDIREVYNELKKTQKEIDNINQVFEDEIKNNKKLSPVEASAEFLKNTKEYNYQIEKFYIICYVIKNYNIIREVLE